MTELYLSIIILAVYIVACVSLKLRLDFLARKSAAGRRRRRINAYTMTKSNVVSLDNWSRKV